MEKIMSIGTQLFLSNLILILTIIALDINVFANYLDGDDWLSTIFQRWLLLSVASIPTWLFYIVWS